VARHDANQPLASAPRSPLPTPYYYHLRFCRPARTRGFYCQAALDNPDLADAAVSSRSLGQDGIRRRESDDDS